MENFLFASPAPAEVAMCLVEGREVTIAGKQMSEQKSYILELSFYQVEALRSAIILALGTPEEILDPEDRRHLMTIKKMLSTFSSPKQPA
jgi:hypothetical protein